MENWHSPTNHAKAFAVVITHDVYLEVAEGNLDANWKVDEVIDFWTFRDLLSDQMLEHPPPLGSTMVMRI